jgi:hypothetical protein
MFMTTIGAMIIASRQWATPRRRGVFLARRRSEL